MSRIHILDRQSPSAIGSTLLSTAMERVSLVWSNPLQWSHHQANQLTTSTLSPCRTFPRVSTSTTKLPSVWVSRPRSNGVPVPRTWARLRLASLTRAYTPLTRVTHPNILTVISYDRTPPCSEVSVTQCSQFYHEVQISGLKADTTYYYQISAANGTTASDVLPFTTSRAAGDSTEFTVAVLNDMGYTNAGGTYQQLLKAVDEGVAFAWHGGDISYGRSNICNPFKPFF